MKTLLIAASLLCAVAYAHAASSFDAGVRLMTEKRYPEAIKLLEREAHANPGSPEVLLNLGWAYWHSRKIDKAWNVGATLVKLDPENVAFMTFLANTEIERKNYPRAIELTKRALQLAPDDKNASMVLARALFRGKRETEALATLDKLAAVYPDDASIRFRKAAFLSDLGRKKEALAALETLLAAEPGNAAYRRTRAKILSDLGQPEEAKAEWRSLTRKQVDADSMLNLGWTYWHEKNIEGAREIAVLLLKLDDKNPTFLRFMANMEIESMNYPEALRLSERALELQPGDRDAMLTQSKALFRLQRVKEASAVLKTLIAKFPDHPGVQYHWAELLARMGKYDEALVYYDRLIKADPANVKYKFSRASALYDKGEFRRGVAEWEELSLGGGDVASIRRLRDDAFNRRAWLEAAQWQEKIIDIDPNDTAAWERLSKIYTSMQQNPAALMAAEKAISVDPESINAYYLKAEALERMADWPAANKAYREIIRRNPNSLRGYDGLAYVLEAQKEFKPAIKTLHRIAAQIKPSYSPYLLVREARLLSDSGRYAQAQKLLSKVTAERQVAIPVLLYHGISTFDRGDSLPQYRFREQMIALKKKGYRTITVGELDRVLQGKMALPAKPLVITFDDGRTDSFENADPILKDVGFRATMFVHLSKLRKAHFHASPEDISAWEATGRWEMQAHGTQAHDPMTLDAAGHKGHFLPNRMWLPEENRVETVPEFRARVETDYKQARQGVETILGGRRVVAFAYPYGDYGQNDYSNNPESTAINQSLVRKYYRLAFVQEQYGINSVTSNPTDLRRFEVPKYMSAEELTAHLAMSEPWVQAKLVEAQMWVQANQLGRAAEAYAELEKAGIDEPQLWADKGASFEKAGDLFRAQALFAKADDGAPDKETAASARYAKLREHSARAAAPSVALEAQRFTDSETNSLFKGLARGSATIKQVRAQIFGGEGLYDDKRNPTAGLPRIRSREAGASLRWFFAESGELDGFYTRRRFTEGVSGDADVYSVSGSYQVLPTLRLAVRDGAGNVETAAGIRIGRKFHTDGGGAVWDPALNWKVNADYDRSRYNDGNIEHGGRLRLTKRFNDTVSLGAAYFRGESSLSAPEYYTPRRLNQYSGIVTLSRSFGEPNPRTGMRRADATLQYEGGYGFQESGSRAVHSVRGGAALRVLDRVSLTAGGQYSQSPSYIMRRVDGGVAVSF